ncbi:hypothetical protein [Nocardia grenadensis]|uniref:hypothetical protein n=1 Tax=Nocardia grenadensis TaxID=931537 RepID=UPI000A467EAA|nr:hypothetical protein [Nocardia grenadensis]
MAQQGQPGTAGAGTDPAYVPDREVFGAYTHQQIWDLVREELAPAELSRLADTWGYTASAVETAFDEFARDLTRFSGDWSGLAAVAAARAAAAFVRTGDDAVAVCRVVEQLLAADSTAAESVRAAIPPPPSPYLPDPDPAVEAAAGAQRRTAYNTAAATLTAEAQDAMTFGYNPTIPASGDAVPRFFAPGDRAPADEPTTAGAPAPARPDTPAAPPAAESQRGRTPSAEAPDPPRSASPAPAPDDTPKDPAREPDSEHPDPDPGSPTALRGGESDHSPATPRSAAETAAPAPSPTASAPAADGPESSPDAPAPLPDTAMPPSDTPAAPTNTPAKPPAAPAPLPDTAMPPSDTAALSSDAAGNPSDPPPASHAAGSAGTVATATAPATLSTVDHLAADSSTGTTAVPRAPGPIPQQTALPDRGDPSPASAPTPPRAPAAVAGWSPAETAGRADSAQAAPHGGHRPGPANSAIPSAPRSPTPPDADAGASAAQRPGQSEQIARSVLSRPTTEAAGESVASPGTGTEPGISQRSEHPWTRTVRPSGFPLPAAPGPLPARAPEGERSSPDYLHRPNEQLTATPPAVPPVFGEYTGTEDPDRTRPGDGNR